MGCLSINISGVRLGIIFSDLSKSDVMKLLYKIIAGGFFSTITENKLSGL